MAQIRLVWKILIDFLVLLCVAGSLLAVILWATPFHRGFFEDDLTIRLPYKQQTVTEVTLAVAGFALMLATITSNEYLRDRQHRGIGEKFLSSQVVPGWVWETYTSLGVFTFGAACQQLAANIVKYAAGRLRPHFYDVCRPVYNASSPLNEFGYIQEFSCAGADASQFTDMRLSFPSAHSSFAMYTAVFFVFYIQVKCRWSGSKLLRHGIQYAAVMGAWYVALTRVTDHYHHWSDVGIGLLNGALFGALVFIYVLKPKKFGNPSFIQGNPTGTVLPRPVISR